MKNSYLFNEEEINKINLAKFINKLFSKHKELHIINIFLYTSSLVQKGKTVSIRPKLKIATTFKYESFYCFWFNGGAKAYKDEEELEKYLAQDSILKLFNNYYPINFYIREENKKITYNDFEASILGKKEFEDENVDSIFGEKNKISFCREKIHEDLENFLGYELVAKQKVKKQAGLLSKDLAKKNGERTYIKI